MLLIHYIWLKVFSELALNIGIEIVTSSCKDHSVVHQNGLHVSRQRFDRSLRAKGGLPVLEVGVLVFVVQYRLSRYALNSALSSTIVIMCEPLRLIALFVEAAVVLVTAWLAMHRSHQSNSLNCLHCI